METAPDDSSSVKSQRDEAETNLNANNVQPEEHQRQSRQAGSRTSLRDKQPTSNAGSRAGSAFSQGQGQNVDEGQSSDQQGAQGTILKVDSQGKLSNAQSKESLAPGKLSKAPSKESVSQGKLSKAPSKESVNQARISKAASRESLTQGKLSKAPSKESVNQGRSKTGSRTSLGPK